MIIGLFPNVRQISHSMRYWIHSLFIYLFILNKNKWINISCKIKYFEKVDRWNKDQRIKFVWFTAKTIICN